MSATLILTRILWTYKEAQSLPEGLVRDYVDSLSIQQWPGTEHFSECQLLLLSLPWTPSGASPKHTISQTQKAESPSSHSLGVWQYAPGSPQFPEDTEMGRLLLFPQANGMGSRVQAGQESLTRR